MEEIVVILQVFVILVALVLSGKTSRAMRAYPHWRLLSVFLIMAGLSEAAIMAQNALFSLWDTTPPDMVWLNRHVFRSLVAIGFLGMALQRRKIAKVILGRTSYPTHVEG
jgi:hypothetical protein